VVGSRPSVQRHPELPPWRQRELTPIAPIMHALSEAPEGAFAEAAAAPFAKPIAVPPDGEHVAVVEQTIQDRGCHDRIVKYRAPLTDGRFEVTTRDAG